MRIVSTALALVLMAGATPALAAENIDCATTGYDAAGQQTIDDYVSKFTMATLDESGLPDSIVILLRERAQNCASENAWSEQASKTAFLYATANIGERGMRKFSPKASTLADRIDTELSDENSARLWSIVRRISGQAMAGVEDPLPGEDDLIFLGTMLMQLDPDTDADTDQYVGALLGMISLKRTAAKQFASL